MALDILAAINTMKEKNDAEQQTGGKDTANPKPSSKHKRQRLRPKT